MTGDAQPIGDLLRPTPMTVDNVRALLGMLTALDSRMKAPPGEAAQLRVTAWWKLLAPVDPAYAMAWVERAYSEPREWPVQPGEILQAWKDDNRKAANADDEAAQVAREVRERRCVWHRICACPHTECRAGWLDEETTVTNAHGKEYPAVKRCPHCKDAILMAEEQGLIRKPPAPKGRRR